MDEVRMMRPFFFARMTGRHADTERNVPLRLVPITASKSASVIAPSFAAGKMAGLAPRMSIVPNAAIAASAMDFISTCRVTSAATPWAVPPAATISATTASASLELPDTTSTRHPAKPNRSAMPRPIPWLAPVTMTLRPLSEVNIRRYSLSGGSRIEISPAQKFLRQRHGAHGIGRAELLGKRHFDVRRKPGSQQNAPQDHEGGNFRPLLGRERRCLAIACDPRLQQ